MNLLDQIFERITFKYEQGTVSEKVDELKPEFVDDWEDDFDDIHDAYSEQGRGEAEAQVLQEIQFVEEKNIFMLTKYEKDQLEMLLEDYYCL